MGLTARGTGDGQSLDDCFDMLSRSVEANAFSSFFDPSTCIAEAESDRVRKQSAKNGDLRGEAKGGNSSLNLTLSLEDLWRLIRLL